MKRARVLELGLASLALAAGSAANATAATPPQAKIELGTDVFVRESWRDLAGRSVGIVTNQTGVTSSLESTVDAVRRHTRLDVRAIFAPEHGYRGDQPAAAYVPSYIDPRTNLEVFSLYGPTRKPTPEMLERIDALVFDIQDVGDRAYTYISTLAYVMQAAKATGRDVYVLDRPNPIGGTIVEGPVLEPRFSSFIGLYPIAMRHGMTIGELARAFNDAFNIGCKLHVVEMRGYRRDMLWPDTGLAWVQTSPNIPEWDTALVYPATGLLSSAGINNGTNYTKPFKYAGGTRIDGVKLAEYLNARPLPGVYFRSAAWSALSGYWEGKTLTGVELVVTDPHAFLAVRTAVEILCAIRKLSGEPLTFDTAVFDRDWGTDSVRNALASGESAEQVSARCDRGLTSFKDLRGRYLLYS